MSQFENQIGIKLMPCDSGMMGTSNMSVPATLIRTTLSTIQKELRQLEHWLITLSGDSHTIPSQENPSIAALSAKMDHIIKHYESQQLALNHIVDRLDILEGTQDNEDLWLDSGATCLENIIVEPLEPMYIVRKSESESPKADAVKAEQPVVKAEQPVVQAEQPVVQEQLAVKPAVKAEQPVVQEQLAVQPAVKEEQPLVKAEQPAVKEVQDDVPPVNAAPSIIAVPSAEEEEDEGGVELEEVTYKNNNYYKDPTEGFIYGIDEEGQPTDQPIGIWKEKSQSISFYRTQPK